MSHLRFVYKLTEEAKQQLEVIYHDHTDFALRRRAHAILLSDRGFTIGQLQAIFAVDRDTVSTWLDWFEQSGVEGLKPLPRPGRPTIYTADEVRQLKALVDQEPRQIKQAPAALQQVTGKSSCTETIKRALKKSPTTRGIVAAAR
jgi:transposase